MQHMLPLLKLNNMEATTPQSSKQQQLMRTVSISVLVMSLPVLYYVSFLHVPPAALFRDTTFWFLMSNSIIIVIAADSGMLFFRSSASPADDDDDDVGGGLSSLAVAAVVKNARAPLSVGVSGDADAEAIRDQQALVVREHADPIADESDRAYALVGRAAAATTPETGDIVVVVSPSATDVDAGAIVPAVATMRLTASQSQAEKEEEERRATRRRRRRHGHRPSHSHSQALVPVHDKSVVVSEERRHLRRAATTERRPPPPPPEEEESEYSKLSDEELNRRVEEFIARFNREIRLQLEKEEQAANA